MTREDVEARIGEIGQALNAFTPAWPSLKREVRARIEDLTAQLVSSNDEQTRGRIKAFMEILDLPESLAAEREGLSAGLSEHSDPAL